jgi:tetratricopeptide (TPR) repeat protein
MKNKMYQICVALLVVLMTLTTLASPAFATSRLQEEDPQTLAEQRLIEGGELLQLGQYEEALAKYEEALSLYQEAADPSGVAGSILGIGFIKRSISDYSGALEAYQALELLSKELGDRTLEETALVNIGYIYQTVGQYQEALAYHQQALTIAQEIGDKAGEGTILNNIGLVYKKFGQYREALDYFQQALAILQESGNRAVEGTTLNNIGGVYVSVGQYPEALDYYQRALAIAQETGDRTGEGGGLNNIGIVYKSVGQYQEALGYYQQALVIMQEIGDRPGEVKTLNNIGAIASYLGQYPDALDYFQQALAIAQEIGDRAGEGLALNNIGSIYDSLGQYPDALDYFQQALAIAQEIGDKAAEESGLNNVGFIYEKLGEYQDALGYYQQALAIAQEIGDREAEGTGLNNIGGLYSSLGQYQDALGYYQQALVIAQEIGDRAGEGTRLNNIGFIYSSLAKQPEALDFFQQALLIAQEMGDKSGERSLLNNIAAIYREEGQYEEAIDYSQQALTIARELGDRAGEGLALNNIGGVYDNLGQHQEALDHFQQALMIAQETGDRYREVINLRNIGFIYKEQGDSTQAIDWLQKSVETLESIQGEITVEELKASFAAEQSYTYENLISLLWEAARWEEAFNYAERARARAFLDQLAGGHLDFRAGASANFIEREQILQDEIAALRDQLITLQSRSQSEWDPAAIDALQKDLANLEDEYARLLTEIKVQSPEVAELVSIDVASLADIQTLLDTNTTLVEYLVTADRVLVFLITRDTFDTVELNVSRDALIQEIDAFREFSNPVGSHPDSLKQLYTWLITPLKDRLKTPVIGIVPHGALHYLPFAALTDGERYLSEDYILFTLPSASTLRLIQEKRKPEVSNIIALGNPSTTLPDLKNAEHEAISIARLYETQAWIGPDATESAVRAQASEAGIVHLAAHGEYNPNNPLFSAIHLAADSENDGRLEVHEIFGLDLTKATDLVVLSACQTNIGAISAGDEVVGLNRAFLYAGTPTVIASLWSVDDTATALLMEHFYTRLREGMGKAQALQAAQNEVRQEYPHPYYWAAFVLTGDSGPIPNSAATVPISSNNSKLWVGVTLLFVVIGLLSIFFARKVKKKSLQ